MGEEGVMRGGEVVTGGMERGDGRLGDVLKGVEPVVVPRGKYPAQTGKRRTHLTALSLFV